MALTGTAPSLAQQATPAPSEDVYTDPEGRFSVPIPTNWTVDVEGELVILSDPDGDFTATVLVVEAEDARAGVEAAWEIIDPEFDTTPPPGGEQEVPSAEGVDETVIVTHDPGNISGEVIQTFAQRIGNQVYILVFRGAVDAAIRRNAQIQVIATGFTFGDLESVDLSGVEPAAFTGELVTEFEAYADELLEELEVPGAAVVVVQDDEVVYTGGFGVRELGGDEPVTPDTLMMIGSTTKSFTTLMMATEVDDGLMDWDTRVVEILPEFAVADPEITEMITVRNLVCACTGVPRQDLELFFNANSMAAEDVIESLGTFEFYTAFGEAFQYSNQMVAAGGYVAAAADGGTFGNLGPAYAESLQERVLDPLEMERTTLSLEAAEADPDHATPHGVALDLAYHPLSLSMEAFVEPVAPAGALWSSANELGTYLQLQLGDGTLPDGTEIVSAENLNVTREPQVEVSAQADYGLGWFIEEYKGLKLIQHGGNTVGFTSEFAFLPDANLGIAVLMNAQGANVYGMALRARLLELVYDQPMEFHQQIDFLIEQSEEFAAEGLEGLGDHADPAKVGPFLGRYTNDLLGEITVDFEGERLMVDAGEFAAELRPFDDPNDPRDLYILSDPPAAGFEVEFRQVDGAPVIVIPEGTAERVFQQIEAFAMPEAATPVASPAATPLASPIAATPEAA